MSVNHPAHEFGAADATIDPAARASAALFADALAVAQECTSPVGRALAVGRIRQLLACCAWTDAALALLALEQPRWQLRRLAYDDGEWYCALSKNRAMPEWLDAGIETHHAEPALAILAALAQARNESEALSKTATVAGAPETCWEITLCDNFV